MTQRPGFTLLEVMIALVIAGLAAAALLNAAGSGLVATATASMYDQAIVRAKSHLAAATHGMKLAPGDWRGDDGGGFQWRLHVARLASATVQPASSAASQPPGSAGLTGSQPAGSVGSTGSQPAGSVGSTASQPIGSARSTGLQPPGAVPVVLYGVTVWIGWSAGDTERQVRLDTEQVGGAG
jgi:prepilin-type N-terminal cleavage/methylation domain-containing protein